jgi:two-component system, OmpR family, response regulator RegX3
MTILIVDNDALLAASLAFIFRREKYDVVHARNGATALRRYREIAPTLILLDVNLPDMEGFALCRSIRAESDIPMILLGVQCEEDDIIRGLEIGADDYIVKPFSLRQLLARTKALLRRAGSPANRTMHEVGALTFDSMRRELYMESGDKIRLSSLESRLLDYFLINMGQVLPFEAIIEHLWGPEGGTHSMVRQLVYRVRNKVETHSHASIQIHSVVGIGYELHSDFDTRLS